jgi:hypothetical protein
MLFFLLYRTLGFMQIPDFFRSITEIRTTELNIVELDTYGNYRDRTSHNKKKYTLFGILIP